MLTAITTLKLFLLTGAKSDIRPRYWHCCTWPSVNLYRGRLTNAH